MLGICFWLPLGVCTYLALTPAPALDTGSAPVNHVLAFGYLTPALRLAHFDRSGWRPVIFWMLAYGIGLELVQGALPWRDAEVRDIALDGAGILAGVVLHRAVRWFRGGAERGHAGSSAPRTAGDDSSPDFSPSHGCGRGATGIDCVERGQGARRTIKYDCAP